MFKPITSEEDRKRVGMLVKKKRMTKTNVYFNKKSGSGDVKYFHGKFFSKKNKTTFIYRSSYELKFFLDLEADSNVDSYVSECINVPYIDAYGTRRTYIPDLLVLYKDGSMEVLEIKPRDMLKDADVQRKAAACRSYIEKNYKGEVIRYRFVTEKDLFKTTKVYTEFLKTHRNKDYSK